MSDHNTIFQPVNDFVQSIVYTRMQKFKYDRSIARLCDKYIGDMNAVLESKTGCSESAQGYIDTLEIIKEEYDIATQIMIDNILIRTQ